jgi:polynucleotide 5'-kinase involved in rRNA processing
MESSAKVYSACQGHHDLDTIVCIGTIGSGKSSFANALALRDNQDKLPKYD